MPELDVPPLCRRVRDARERAGLSQEEVARRIPLTLKGYAAYERHREPKPRRAREIALALGLPEDYFEAPAQVSAAEAQDLAARLDRIEQAVASSVAQLETLLARSDAAAEKAPRRKSS